MRMARLVPPSGQDKKLQTGGLIPKPVLQQAVPLDLLHLDAVGGDLLIPSLKGVVEGQVLGFRRSGRAGGLPGGGAGREGQEQGGG